MAVASGVADARNVDGHVFEDRDGDGVFSAGDVGVAGAVVAWNTNVFTTTDAGGAFAIVAPTGGGHLWVSTPDGYRPPASWALLDDALGDITQDLIVAPDPLAGQPLRFVNGSDLHIGKSQYLREQSIDAVDLEWSVLQATAISPAPRFLVATGDLVQSNQPEQYAMIRAVVDELETPFVPVPGNHDWFDGGASFRDAFGPPMYSFNAGGVHFIVLNDNASVSSWTSFLNTDLSFVDDAIPVVAFIHRPAPDSELAAIADAGVAYLFTGHWHSNAMFEYGGMIALTTQPLIRGGMDAAPAGYRIVELTEAGLSMSNRSVVDAPNIAVSYPRPGDCASGRTIDLIAAVEVGGSDVSVTARVNGGAPVTLAPVGGWDYTGELAIPLMGAATIDIDVAVAGAADGMRVTEEIEPCMLDGQYDVAGEWAQVQGGPDHHGAADVEIAPPLATRWATAVGGTMLAGGPVVAGGRVFVTVADLAGGETSALVALDAADGSELWRYLLGSDIRNAAAVADGIVVTGSTDGIVHAVDAATGQLLWSYDIGDGLEAITAVQHAPPAIAGDVVYAAVHRRFAALDLHTGALLWDGDPSPGQTTLTSLAAPAIEDGVIVGSVARGRGGLFAWDAMLGSELWRIERPKSIGVHAAAVLADSVAYYANAAGQVRAVELQTGDEIWAKSLFAGNSDWDYAITGTPALSDGRLFVPTQYDFLYALDAATGDELWRIRADDSVLHTSHARVIAQSFPGSPLVSGRYLYAGGADGLLRSLEVDTGVQLWSLQLGSPIMSGMAAAGDQLYVQSFDGTVRAMVHVDRPLPDPQDPDGGADDGGCGCSASSDQTPWSPLALALACWLAISAVRSRGGRARRRARSRAPRCGP